MMTIDDLTSWRVAAINGHLPEPCRSDRWQPLRAGLVNMWEYDAAEVWYADGRMQLQGANESGKSTLMTLTTLLLLAGETSSHNIDTLGQNDKRFRYYVEPTDHALDRRDTSAQKNRGWAWMEFGRGTEFLTLMLFAETRRADAANVSVTWCTLHGPARIRSGVSLTTAGFVNDPARFKEVPGFTAHDTGTAYRETIARVLYSADDAWLNQLIRILRVVRTPQIGHKIDLKFLTESFRIALPPIAEDEIRQLADGWDQLRRLRLERDEAEQALAAVTEFSRQSWRPWANAVVRAAADPVTAAASVLTQITREERAASSAVERLTAEKTSLGARRDARESERQTANAQYETIRDSAAYQSAKSAAANAEQLAARAADAESTASDMEERAGEAAAALEPAADSLARAEQDLESAERIVATAQERVAAQADGAGLTELAAQYLPDRDVARLRQGANLRVTLAQQAAGLIATHARTLTALEAEGRKAREAQSRLDHAHQQVRDRDAEVEASITAVGETLAVWTQGLDEPLRPPAELVEDWSGQVAALTDAGKPAPVLAIAIGRDHLNPVRQPHEQRKATLNSEMSRNEQTRSGLSLDLSAVEAERDPVPGAPEFWTRRERPDGVSAAGSPFWRLVETLDGTPAAELEAALDAAGLLQAWVTPDAAYLAARDDDDTVWTPGTRQSSGTVSLRAVLRPADDAGELAPVVERLLASVCYGDGLADGPTSVSADGAWRHGDLTGHAAPAPGGPRLLGAAARAADRNRRIERLRERIEQLRAEHAAMSEERDAITSLLQTLDTIGASLPSDADVVSAILAAREASRRAKEAEREADDASQAVRTAEDAANAAAAEVARHCDEYQFPRVLDDLNAVIGSLSDFISALSVLEAELRGLDPLRRAVADRRENLDRIRKASEKATTDAARYRATATDLRTRSDAAQEALSQGAQELLARASRLQHDAEELRQAVSDLDLERANITGELTAAKTSLAQVAERRQEADDKREAAARRWWDCVDSGLPGLRGVPEAPARHVTAALDNARAARSVITIRNWPDSEHQDRFAQWVQSRWLTMTEASSQLRSRLEVLGGRTIQVNPPGEGREDFPGSVELVIDSTGTSFAPPAAAERLSALLVRLQEEYDEELTRTIDELLGSTFIEHLRDRLTEAEMLRDDINKKLEQNPTAISGITLRLRRVPVTEERNANDVLDTLERDFAMLPKPAQERIRGFLSERITLAQEEARAEGDPNWRARLAEILDYRRWFELRLEYRTPRSESGDRPGGGWRSLERGDHGLLSGGAKVVTLMQPFIAALHAMYDQAGSGPRMLWLDEAFGGVDGTNKASMFRLLTSCDLDWLIAGPGVIANSAAVPMASIYEVRRAPQPLPGVSLELAVWAGNELTHVMAPDPADLRDLAAPDEPDDDGTLFADL